MQLHRAAVALVVAGLSTASLSIAASHEPGEIGLVVLPPPRLGDVATYLLQEGNTSRHVALSLQAGDPMQMPDGAVWDTVHARLGAPAGHEDAAAPGLAKGAIYDPSLSHVLGLMLTDRNATAASGELWPGFPLTASSSWAHVWGLTLYMPAPIAMPECVLALPRELREDRAFRMNLCLDWLSPIGLAQGTWQPRGVQAFGEDAALQALVFEADDGRRMHLAEGIPYPVELSHGNRSMRLVAFAQGDQALADDGPRAGASLPPLLWRPRSGPLLMDGALPGHPFPIEEAFEAAREQEAVAAYLREHPQAVVASAEVWRDELPNRHRWTWVMLLADAGAAGRQQALAVLAERDVVPGLPPALAKATASTAARATDRPEVHLPEMPGLALDAGSVFQRAAWQGVANQGCYGYSFAQGLYLGPGYSAGSCWRSMAAGLDGPGPHVAMEYDVDLLLLRPDGSHHGRVTLVAEGKTVPDLPASAAEPPEAKARQPSTMPGSTPAWAPAAAGAGILGLLAAILYLFWPQVKILLGLAGFSRLQDATAHPRRQAILRLVRSEPGMHVRELGRRLGLPNGSLLHHLQVLERDGAVETRAEGGRRQVFPRGQAAARARATGMKPLGPEAVAGIVRLHPGLTVGEVALKSGLAPSTVSYHVGRLRAAGRLRAERSGHALRLFPAA